MRPIQRSMTFKSPQAAIPMEGRQLTLSSQGT